MIKALNCIEHGINDFSLDDEEIAFLNALAEGINFDENDGSFLNFSQLDPFTVKKEIIADHIKSLVHHIGKSHSELCNELGWKKSRFSKVISGNANLTLKTIFEISTVTGYDFDIVFNNKNKKVCYQPWNQFDSELEVFFDETSINEQLPIVDFIDPYNLVDYVKSVDFSDVQYLLGLRRQKPKLKDVYEDKKSIENSFYSIPIMQDKKSDDEYFAYQIPRKYVVEG